VREGGKRCAQLGIEAPRRLDETFGAVADQVARLHGLGQAAPELGSDRMHKVQMILDQPILVSRHDGPN